MFKYELTEQIKSILLKAFNIKPVSVILYGSYAENRATKYSDVDLLIVVNKDFSNWREKRRIEVALRKNTSSLCQISPKIITQKELLSALENYNPLILNVVSSGKTLYDTGSFEKAKEMFKDIFGKKITKTPEGYWELAL